MEVASPATYWMSIITLETLIDAPAELCFDLARDIDAHIASTAGSEERAVAGVTTGLLGAGDEVTWEARHLGFRWRLTSRITEFDRPRRFVDEQTQGPFYYWRHEHRFQPWGETTQMVDEVHYRIPFGIIGRLVERFFLHRYLTRLLERRCQYLKVSAEEQPRR